MRTHDEELLRRSSLFHLLPDDDYAKVRPLLQEEHYEFGDVIVRQGDEADAFYILISGRARAIKAQADGQEIALATLRPGDSFGEAALADGGRRNATIRCSTAVDVLRLDRESFLKLLDEEPELKDHVQKLSRRRAVHGFLYEFTNFGRLPAPALRGIIEKLAPVVVQKGGFIVEQGAEAGRCSFWRKVARGLLKA
jgi:ATP-binding cassette subfamily B protein